jgi:hypothetical protein
MGWIKTTEQLPDERRKPRCIVWHEETMSEPMVAVYIGGRQFHDFFRNWVNVSHWMPMPLPPE